MSNIKPIVSKEDVRKVFNRQLDEYNNTTSLDVKNELREEGYWATQERVTGFMREICEEDSSIDFDFNGIYREYTRSYPNTTQQTFTNTAAPRTVTQFTKEDREPVTLGDVEDGDWEVTDSTSSGAKTEFYKGYLTPGVAKYEYSKTTGIPFTDVRVKRVNL